jgi:uncharacterized protein (TIGR03435 family)
MKARHAPIVVVLIAFACAVVSAQAPASDSQPPAFEVASIKPNTSRDIGRRFGFPGDRFVATNQTLRELVAIAYGRLDAAPQPLPNYRISGGPSWVTADRFDVVGKVPATPAARRTAAGQNLLMLQALLRERFHLVVHTETKRGPIYAMMLSRPDGALGPQLHRSSLDCAAVRASGRSEPPPGSPRAEGRVTCGLGFGFQGGMIGGGRTMTELATALSAILDREVVDRSGLAGVFDLSLEFNSEGLPGLEGPPGVERGGSDRPSIFTALREQFGLKLEATKGSVEVLVIDHAERPTPE